MNWNWIGSNLFLFSFIFSIHLFIFFLQPANNRRHFPAAWRRPLSFSAGFPSRGPAILYECFRQVRLSSWSRKAALASGERTVGYRLVQEQSTLLRVLCRTVVSLCVVEHFLMKQEMKSRPHPHSFWMSMRIAGSWREPWRNPERDAPLFGSGKRQTVVSLIDWLID